MSVDTVLLLGSGPNATDARAWTDHPFDRIVAINNAWAVRPDWTDLIYPFDFPADRMPTTIKAGQRLGPCVRKPWPIWGVTWFIRDKGPAIFTGRVSLIRCAMIRHYCR